MGTHLRVLSESYLMNTDMIGFRWESQLPLHILVLWTKVASALEGLTEPWHMGTHLRVLSESYLMNTNMTGFR